MRVKKNNIKKILNNPQMIILRQQKVRQEDWMRWGGLLHNHGLEKEMKELYDDSRVMNTMEKSEYDRSWPQGDLDEYWIDKKAYDNLPNCPPSPLLNEDEERRAFTSYLRPIWGSVKDQYDIMTHRGYHSLFRVP